MFRIPLYELKINDAGPTRTLYTELTWAEAAVNWFELRKEGYQVYIVKHHN